MDVYVMKIIARWIPPGWQPSTPGHG